MLRFRRRRRNRRWGDPVGSDLSSTDLGVAGLAISVAVAVVVFVLPFVLSRRARRRTDTKPQDRDT